MSTISLLHDESAGVPAQPVQTGTDLGNSKIISYKEFEETVLASS